MVQILFSAALWKTSEEYFPLKEEINTVNLNKMTSLEFHPLVKERLQQFEKLWERKSLNK